MNTSIIDASAEEAKRFFLKQESFCSIVLPKYFDFQNLLNELTSFLAKYKENKTIKSDFWEENPKTIENVNYHFFQNKDGRFSWRPLQIINPILYVDLVNEITKEDNWTLMVERFYEFAKNDKIKCYSLPIINLSKQKYRANTILNWWEEVEQQSIQLSMDFNYLMTTDITDCYGSIYTHSITWAMCGKENAKIKHKYRNKNKERDEERLNAELLRVGNIKLLADSQESADYLRQVKNRYSVGDTIDLRIQAMSYQQTNGIPQGSTLMDFIAELVLGYADLLLSEEINKANISDYRILRYRDDYRIFGNSQEDVIKIAKILTEVLSGLNFRLNTQKTMITQDLINGAIKPDKLYYITNGYKDLEEKDNNYSLQKHLLRINRLAQEHPNSGSVQKSMDLFFKRILNTEKLDLYKEFCSSDVLISILTNIAFNNPKVYKTYVAIVSKILSQEPNVNKKEDVIKKILKKFEQLPNVGYLEIWLQRLTIKENRNKEFSEPLCQYAANANESIWNIDWLKEDIKNIFQNPDNSCINEDEINRLTEYIEYHEVENFSRYV